MNNKWLYLAIALLVSTAWMFRWDVFSEQSGSDAPPKFYLLDRWTGNVWQLVGSHIQPVTLEP